MPSPTQLARYKKLLPYLEQHFKEDINLKKVEALSPLFLFRLSSSHPAIALINF